MKDRLASLNPDRRRAEPKQPQVKAAKTSKLRNGEETKARLIEVCTPLFFELGFDKVSTRMICDAMGISVPTIYLYFKDKRALFITCCVEAFRKNSNRVESALSEDGPVEVKIFRAIREISSISIEEPHIALLFQRELADQDKEVLHALDRETFHEPLGLLQALVDQCPDTPAPLGGISIFALIFGLIQYHQTATQVLKQVFGRKDRVDQVTRHVMKTVLPKSFDKLSSSTRHT